MPKFLPGKRIAQVHFDKRDLNSQEGISQRNTGMRETTGVQDDKFDVFGSGLLDPVDELMLGVTLKALQLMSKFTGDCNTALLDVGKTGCAIDIGFA